MEFFKHLKWPFIVILVIAVGFILLRFTGGLFIREITQEVSWEGPAADNASIGKPAPYFELPSAVAGSDPAKAKLSDFSGTPLVLTFWTTWNERAADQIRILDEYVAKKGEGLFKIIAVSSQEDPSVVLNFMTRGGYRVRALLDRDGAVTEQYQARSLPMTFFVDKEGIVRDAFVGVLSEEMLIQKTEMILK